MEPRNFSDFPHDNFEGKIFVFSGDYSDIYARGNAARS